MARQTNQTWWTREKNGDVKRADLGAARLALDLELGERSYDVILSPAADDPAAWSGAWMRHDEPGTGAVSARLYRAAGGGFALIGEWSEDGTVYRWVAEFQAAR